MFLGRSTSLHLTRDIQNFRKLDVSLYLRTYIANYIFVFQPFLVRIVALQSTLQPLSLKGPFREHRSQIAYLF